MVATAFFGSALCKASSSQTIAGRMSSEPENIGGSLMAAITASSSQNSIEVMFNAFMENACSEQGARMSAMDSSSRNAGEMLDRLTLSYNRTRQAAITTELIEIISGASALTG